MSKRSKRLREFTEQPEEAMDLARLFEAACKRYPRIIARLAEYNTAKTRTDLSSVERGWTPEAFLAALSRRPTYYYLPKRKAKRFYFWLGREAEGVGD